MDEFEEARIEKVQIAKELKYTKMTFRCTPALVSINSNNAGWHQEFPYHGGEFDSSRYRLIKNGWDHAHCFLCNITILDGDIWWAELKLSELGLCVKCFDSLFVSENVS